MLAMPSSEQSCVANGRYHDAVSSVSTFAIELPPTSSTLASGTFFYGDLSSFRSFKKSKMSVTDKHGHSVLGNFGTCTGIEVR